MKNRRWKTLFTLLLAAALVVTPLQGALGEGFTVMAQSQYPDWQAGEAYSGGSKVVFEGNVYEAMWWTQGDNPASPSNPNAHPWQLVGPAENDGNDGGNEGGGTAPVGEYPAWVSGATYLAGERVVYNGTVYEAQWWTQNETPGTVAVWKMIGPGEATEPTDPTPSPSPTTSPNPNPDPSPSPSPSIPPVDESQPGDSKVLTDAEIVEEWGGIDPKYSPANAELRLEQYLSQDDFEELFPRRYGSAMWHATGPAAIPAGTTVPEYYSYANLKAGIKHVANIMYKVEYRTGVMYAPKITVLNKETKTETVISMNPDFNASWNVNKAIDVKIVDFGCFLADGTENDKRREIAGFLANIAHETSGGWATAPDGILAWGLYFNEEVSYTGTNQIGYVDSTNQDFPAVSGKSYHGRGPIQLSWNYNYGLISGILYQDKNILLNNPELVTQDGKLGFMTALLFWMTPQAPKPSCHDVITGIWSPTAVDIAKGITEAGFGATINIINGGFEAGKDASDYRVGRRIGHYLDITSRNGADITGEKLDTLGMQAW
ncbi:MAG: carbohydrate-binding protein [Lachnospiraceae bacterium]|nr:carbohydrate-binding protein [Lachnospiraceae bacterium]